MLDFSRCALIITGCMNPNLKVPNLVLQNASERKKQYIDSLKFYIMHTRFKKIIYGDSSNCPEEQDVINCAKEYGKQIEWLNFYGDSKAVEKNGKGYGEGEIIEYIFEHSNLLKEVDYIIKITGRLIVKNINFLSAFAQNDVTYFQPSIFEDGKLYINTRLYMMPKAMYEEYFKNAYKRVRDREKIYLEHTFGEVVQEKLVKYKCFLVYPNYLGISGSTGISYNSSWVTRLKNTIRMYMAKYEKINSNKYHF